MNQPIENRPTFNIYNSSLAHSLLYHMYYKIDQHGSSSCCFKGVTHDALTLCYKLIIFYIDF